MMNEDAELQESLRAAAASARNTWPAIQVADELFIPFLAGRAGQRLGAPAALTQAADLYLCCACLLKNPRAIAVFESQYVPALRKALSRVRLDATEAEELLQVLRVRLITGDNDGPPKLAEYRGAGSLLNWLRVVAVNAALNTRRRSTRERPLSDAESELPLSTLVSDSDPELEHLRSYYHGTLREALSAALCELQEEQRTLLRLSILDGLSIDELGRLLRVHRATAARKVAAARELLLSNTKRQLQQRARLREGEVTSVLRALVNNLEVSISELLK